MPTLDIWSNSLTTNLRDLFSSSLACLLLRGKSSSCKNQNLYICSPWISEFRVFDNRYGQFEELFPSLHGKAWIGFADTLRQLSEYGDINIISKATEATKQFIQSQDFSGSRVQIRFGDQTLHEKGFLSEDFYIEGSMNITYSGFNVNREKVSFHSGEDVKVKQLIRSAYLELDRRWVGLEQA